MRCHACNEPLIKEIDRQGQNKPFQRGSRIKAKWGLSRYPLRIESGEQARAIRGVQDLYSSEIDAYLANQKEPIIQLSRDAELEFFIRRIRAVDDIINAFDPAPNPPSAGSDQPVKRARKNNAAKADEILGYSNDGSYVMLLDNRELNKKNIVFAQLLKDVEWCIPYQLPVGDMLWAYRCSQISLNRTTSEVTPLTKYYLTGLIVERKTHRDLSNSIIDERYKAQIQRLKAFSANPGLLTLPIRDNDSVRYIRSIVIILIEKSGQIDPSVVNVKAIETAIIKFQCRDGFFVIHSNSNAHSTQLLSSIHTRIAHSPREPPSETTLSLIPETVSDDGDPIDENGLLINPPCGSKRLSIGTSTALYSKSAGLTAYDIYKKQLRMIPHIQPADAEYLLNEFPTFYRLIKAAKSGNIVIGGRRADLGISQKVANSLRSYLGLDGV